jgi:hypothetical protein
MQGKKSFAHSDLEEEKPPAINARCCQRMDLAEMQCPCKVKNALHIPVWRRKRPRTSSNEMPVQMFPAKQKSSTTKKIQFETQFSMYAAF